jgi:hypothetical protein
MAVTKTSALLYNSIIQVADQIAVMLVTIHQLVFIQDLKVCDDGTLIQILCFWMVDNVQKHNICSLDLFH